MAGAGACARWEASVPDSRPTALITGASSGIGLELARLFARHGHDLVLVARREAELERIKRELEEKDGVTVRVVACDLSEPGAPSAIVDELRAAGVQVDVLVNNAGYAMYGSFVEADLDAGLNML